MLGSVAPGRTPILAVVRRSGFRLKPLVPAEPGPPRLRASGWLGERGRPLQTTGGSASGSPRLSRGELAARRNRQKSTRSSVYFAAPAADAARGLFYVGVVVKQSYPMTRPSIELADRSVHTTALRESLAVVPPPEAGPSRVAEPLFWPYCARRRAIEVLPN